MKVYINRFPVLGPWGGGSKVLAAVIYELGVRGHSLSSDLNDADAYFCFDPRKSGIHADYQTLYAISRQRNKPLIQRVGDLGTHGKPELTEFLKKNLAKSDLLIFPSEYARDYLKDEFDIRKSIVIPNGPMKCFYERRNENLNPQTETLKIVTHHWSLNPKKGFPVYEYFDKATSFLESKFSMTYIGRLPDGLSFRQIDYRPPMNAQELASILPTFDVYLTASEDEAGANHVLEAAAAGLPIVCSALGGSIPEYCHEFGAVYGSYNPSLFECLAHVRKNYQSYKTRV